MDRFRFALVVLLGVFVFLATLALAVPQGNEGGEPSDAESGALRLVSETAKCSAQIYCNENATDAEKEEDKKREDIGIGEVVTIRIVGKESLLLPTERIRWVIVKGVNMLTKIPKLNGVREIELELRRDIKKDELVGGIEVKASTKKVKLVGPKKLTVVFPESLKGEHIPDPGPPPKAGTLPANCNWSDGNPNPSATAALLVSIYPRNVSFSNIWIVEKDNGFKGNVGSLSEPHKADSTWTVSDKNEFMGSDNMGTGGPIEIFNGTYQDEDGNTSPHTYPNQYTWDCKFMTYNYRKTPPPLGTPLGEETICHIDQDFLIERRGAQFYIKVSKFPSAKQDGARCTVERTSGGNHIFNP